MLLVRERKTTGNKDYLKKKQPVGGTCCGKLSILTNSSQYIKITISAFTLHSSSFLWSERKNKQISAPVQRETLQLTFLGLETCCTHSIAGLRICSFFDIKTFIGGRLLFCIFKPIELFVRTEQSVSLGVLRCACVHRRVLSVSKWLRRGRAP